MRKSISILKVYLSLNGAIGSFAQGTIVFYNHSLWNPVSEEVYHAPVTLSDGGGAAGDAFTAGLYVVRSDGLELLSTRTFQVRGFIDPVVVRVPGISWGQPATVRVRVWETGAGSYENAIAQGKLFGEFPTGQPNNDLLVPVLGGDPLDILLPARLDGLQPLQLVPEPQTWALFLIGGVILLAARRRTV